MGKEVMPMEQFLVNVLAAVVAGVLVALISRYFLGS
jgi:fluoride ion exporter CrcB/FEX